MAIRSGASMREDPVSCRHRRREQRENLEVVCFQKFRASLHADVFPSESERKSARKEARGRGGQLGSSEVESNASAWFDAAVRSHPRERSRSHTDGSNDLDGVLLLVYNQLGVAGTALHRSLELLRVLTVESQVDRDRDFPAHQIVLNLPPLIFYLGGNCISWEQRSACQYQTQQNRRVERSQALLPGAGRMISNPPAFFVKSISWILASVSLLNSITTTLRAASKAVEGTAGRLRAALREPSC
eukprot:1690384-Rhodomonas_salina.3